MNVAPWRGTSLAGAGLLTVVAVLAGPNESVAAAAALGALLSALAFIALGLVPRVRWRPGPSVHYERHALVALRQAFREGPIGRQRIAQSVLELERSSVGRPWAHSGDEIALHPEASDPGAFRAWVARRLDELEGST